MVARVFISYARQDAMIADQIASVLSELKIRCFLDTKDINWGDPVNEEIRGALEGCQEAVVVLSPASLKSQWVAYEIGHARAMRKKVLPFLTHPSLEVPSFMRDLQFVATIEEVRKYFSPRASTAETAASEETVASAKGISPKERDAIRSRRNDLVKTAIEKQEGVKECFIVQLEDHTDKGYALMVSFDGSTSAADVVAGIRSAFVEVLPDVPIWGEMKDESEDTVIFAFLYIDPYNRLLRSKSGV